MNNKLYSALLLAMAVLPAAAQEDGGNKITVSGSVQSDVLIPQGGTVGSGDHERKVNEWALTNTYADVNVMSKHLDAGARFEFTKHPLPGFDDKGFRGWGVPYMYLKAHYDKWDLTVGNFYEQFGSGFILRTYEERSLGIDNSILGGRLVVKPLQGVTVKALSGKQRRYWSHNDSWISGGDLELNVDQWLKGMQEHNTYLTLGGSWVNKHEKADETIMSDASHILNLPENVNAFDVRANLQAGNFNILGEYAWKTDDPSNDGKFPFIYRKGTVAMLSTSYSKSGMSILLQAKRSDNMQFKSMRSEALSSSASSINHLPAFTMDQTYALAALYPYATQPNGEWAYQAAFGYKFKRHTLLGGKYGTDFKVNFSHVHALDRNSHAVNGNVKGTDGYGSAFWKWGDETYYQDLNFQIGKKLSKSFSLNLMYMNQFYNNTVLKTIEREDGKDVGMVHSDIFILDGKYRFNKKFTLRGEAQYLSTDDAQGDWWFGLLELSVLPHWMFTVSDMYNSGETHDHYYQGFITFNAGSHRLQVGYGRTRAGFNCSGGVCRYVPESKGVTISYNYNF